MDILYQNLTSKVDGHALDTGLTQIAEKYVLPYYMTYQFPLFLTQMPNIWYTNDRNWSITLENGYIQVASNSTGVL